MKRILLAEDEKMIRYGIYVMIENSGVPCRTITECRNGREAVECLKKDVYDLILTDIRMPFMGGIELAQWIEDNLMPEERPLLAAISGYAEFEYAKSMLKYQAIDYLLKPVDREELAKVLWHAEESFRERWPERAADNEPEDGGCALSLQSRQKMQKAVDYIRRNYDRPIDMAEVSNHISMNYSMFSALFKEYTGENFSGYLRKLRIGKSKRLLTGTDLSINEVSQRAGFEDARRFAKVFKEETSWTPTRFRENALEQKNDT